MLDLLACEDQRLADMADAQETYEQSVLEAQIIYTEEELWCMGDPTCIEYWEGVFDAMIAVAQAVRDAAIDDAWDDYFDCSDDAYTLFFLCTAGGGGKAQ